MNQLQRSSAGLLIGGGALMTALLVALLIDPASPALYGFFLAAPVTGLGVLGAALEGHGGNGRLARIAAWVAVAGGILVVVVGAYAIATNQLVLGTGVGSDDPMSLPFALTSTAWMLGSLGFAAALLRAGGGSRVGAWLVLSGTLLALILGSILGELAPDLSPLAALPFGVGWVVTGWNLRIAARTHPGVAQSMAR